MKDFVPIPKVLVALEYAPVVNINFHESLHAHDAEEKAAATAKKYLSKRRNYQCMNALQHF